MNEEMLEVNEMETMSAESAGEDNPSVSEARNQRPPLTGPLGESEASRNHQSPPCVKGGGADEGSDGGIVKEEFSNPAPQTAEQEADPRLADIRQFTAHFPGVTGEDVPPAVWEMVRGGLPLTAAYAIHRCRALHFEVETLKQNAAARARSTGSMTGLGDHRADPLDEGWYED